MCNTFSPGPMKTLLIAGLHLAEWLFLIRGTCFYCPRLKLMFREAVAKNGENCRRRRRMMMIIIWLNPSLLKQRH